VQNPEKALAKSRAFFMEDALRQSFWIQFLALYDFSS
jgi:hypothetical protein